jgi:hypothetical protein
MIFNKFANSDVKISSIGFGTWALGSNKATGYGKINIREAINTIHKSIEKKINFFDTSNLYGNGYSEEILGKIFYKRRDNVFIASKGGCLPHKTLYMPQDFSGKALDLSLDGSLKRLKTDYLDLFQLHSPTIEHFEKKNCIDTLIKYKKTGKCKFIGISARTPNDALYFLKKYPIDSLQVNFNLIDQRALDINLFKIAKKKRVSVIVRTPLVFGFLSGKVNYKKIVDKNDIRLLFPKEQLEIWQNSIKLFLKIKEKNITKTQFALKYCLSFSGVTTVIPGMINQKQLIENTNLNIFKKMKNEKLKIRQIYKNNNFYFEKLRDLKNKNNYKL